MTALRVANTAIPETSISIEQKPVDKLRDGDTILMRVSSISRTETGYVTFTQSTGPYAGCGRTQTLPPETVVTVATTNVAPR